MGLQTTLRNKPNPKNVFINGGLPVWQRGNEGNVSITGAIFVPDRFEYFTALGLTLDITKESSPPEGQNSVRFERLLGSPSLLNNTLNFFSQPVEGTFGKDSIGKEMVVSFWVRCNRPVTSAYRMQNSLGNRTFLQEYTVDVANEWEKKTIRFTLEDGTYDTGTGRMLTCSWGLDVGSDYHGVEGWQTGDFYGTATQDIIFQNSGDYIEFAGFMMYEEVHGLDIPFVSAGNNYTEELQLCQRYYRPLMGGASSQYCTVLGYAFAGNRLLWSDSNLLMGMRDDGNGNIGVVGCTKNGVTISAGNTVIIRSQLTNTTTINTGVICNGVDLFFGTTSTSGNIYATTSVFSGGRVHAINFNDTIYANAEL